MTKARTNKADKHKKPAPSRVEKPKMRTCLMCQESFMSEWSGERVCRQCKTKSEWRSGGSWLPEIRLP